MKLISLPAKTGIAIQGPTKYYKEISEFYKQFGCPVVFCTWKTEPAENVLSIERSGIHMELIDAPEYNGYLNVNMQNISSAYALQSLKHNFDIHHALKIRSDSFIFGLEKLWPKIMGCDISWAHIYNPKADPNWAYNLAGRLHTGMDWIVDYAAFGNINTLINIYNWKIEYNYPVPPESMYMKKWLDDKGLDHNFDIEYFKNNGAVFFGKYFEETNSDLYCIKNGQSFKNLVINQPSLRLV